jgi:hypothetical protein
MLGLAQQYWFIEKAAETEKISSNASIFQSADSQLDHTHSHGRTAAGVLLHMTCMVLVCSTQQLSTYSANGVPVKPLDRQLFQLAVWNAAIAAFLWAPIVLALLCCWDVPSNKASRSIGSSAGTVKHGI